MLADRKRLARNGVVVAVVPIDGKTRRMAGAASLWSYGVLDTDEAPDVIAEAREVIAAAIESNGGPPTNADAEEVAREALRQYFTKRTKRRPTILPVAVEA